MYIPAPKWGKKFLNVVICKQWQKLKSLGSTEKS